MRRGALLGLSGLVLALAPVVATSGSASAEPSPASDDSIWAEESGRVPESRGGNERRVDPSDYAAYSLDDTALAARLDRAPARGAGAKGVVLEVPAPSGDLVEFEVVEAPIMEAGLAAAHPEISTYAGRAVDSAATIRLDVTPMGFHASVRGDGASWYVDPAWNGDDSVYLSYLGTSLPAPEKGLVEPDLHDHAKEITPSAGETAPGDQAINRTYRLALVTDPSYARYFGTENVLAEKVTLMNRVNQIYNDDLGIDLVLIDETDKLNLDTDEKAFGPTGPCGEAGCYTPNQFANGCTGGLLNRNRIALGQLVGASAYDVGHIALGINGGGVAGLGVIGGDSKARGCTGLPQPEGDFMAIDYVAHEIGHQFGGNHTFNGTQVNCGGNKAAPSVEPGSGSSVMAYAGICGVDDLQPHTDPYFSQWSQQEITATITANRPAVDEVQTVALNGFNEDGESFTLGYGGATTEPIVRGTNYTAAGIKAALEAILPEGGTVTVSAFGSNAGAPGDTGFQLRFNGATNALAGQDLELVTLTGSEGVTALVGETAQGGPALNGGSVIETSDNRTPVVTAPAQVSIPLRTPFTLTGSATDADGDDMVYLWEQTDRGAGRGTSLVDQVKTNGPLFRQFGDYADVTPAGTLFYNSPGENHADGNPSRTFPDMEQILVGNTNAVTGLCPTPIDGTKRLPATDPAVDCFSEWLPTADYVGSPQANNEEPSLNFRLTARDLDPATGGYGFANTKVIIDKTAGPFLVSSKNSPAAAVAGRTEEVRWAVAGTNTPTLAENVKISLSTDGGRTFPTVLAESTPNDGAEPVTWPKLPTTEARLKIEAVDNVFFDVNDADFEIVADVTAPDTTITSGPADGSVLLATSTDIAVETEAGATVECTLDGDPVDCSSGTAALTDLFPGTHVFEAAATDKAENTDETPATVTFTVPVDDVGLSLVKGGWKRLTAPAAYLDTVTKATRKGATVKFDVTDATGLTLVAPKRSTFGAVKVFVDGEQVGKASLWSRNPVAQRKIQVATFDEPVSGTVTIVTNNKKQVRIDGLAVISQP